MSLTLIKLPKFLFLARLCFMCREHSSSRQNFCHAAAAAVVAAAAVAAVAAAAVAAAEFLLF